MAPEPSVPGRLSPRRDPGVRRAVAAPMYYRGFHLTLDILLVHLPEGPSQWHSSNEPTSWAWALALTGFCSQSWVSCHKDGDTTLQGEPGPDETAGREDRGMPSRTADTARVVPRFTSLEAWAQVREGSHPPEQEQA